MKERRNRFKERREDLDNEIGEGLRVVRLEELHRRKEPLRRLILAKYRFLNELYI